jgi:hypothetical protein
MRTTCFYEEQPLELLAIEINTNNFGKVIIPVVYRPQTIQVLIATCNSIYDNKLILFGDLSAITWPGFRDASDYN